MDPHFWIHFSIKSVKNGGTLISPFGPGAGYLSVLAFRSAQGLSKSPLLPLDLLIWDGFCLFLAGAGTDLVYFFTCFLTLVCGWADGARARAARSAG